MHFLSSLQQAPVEVGGDPIYSFPHLTDTHTKAIWHSVKVQRLEPDYFEL